MDLAEQTPLYPQTNGANMETGIILWIALITGGTVTTGYVTFPSPTAYTTKEECIRDNKIWEDIGHGFWIVCHPIIKRGG